MRKARRGSGRHCVGKRRVDEAVVRKRDPSSAQRDAKYRRKLKNSVNLLESVLPLAKQQRSRQKLYEDALQLTAVLQESLFHLVNQLRIQNQENIYNFKIFTPSYVQSSFVNLIQEVEEEMKNGTPMSSQLVDKVSDMALDFFTGLLMKCNQRVLWDRMPRRSHEVLQAVPSGSSGSSNGTMSSGSSNTQSSLFCGDHQDTLMQEATYIPDYMELDGIVEQGRCTLPGTTTPLQRSYSQHKREVTAPVEKSRMAGAGRRRKHSHTLTHTHTPTPTPTPTPTSTTDTACLPNHKLRRLHSPKSKKQLFTDEGRQEPRGSPRAHSPSSCSDDSDNQHDLLSSSSPLPSGSSEHRQSPEEGGNNDGGGDGGRGGPQVKPQNGCYTVRVNTSSNKQIKSPETATDRIRIIGNSGGLKLYCQINQQEYGNGSIKKTSTRAISHKNTPESTPAAPTSSVTHSTSLQDTVDKEEKSVESDPITCKILKSTTSDQQGHLTNSTTTATFTSGIHTSTSQETKGEEKKYVKSGSLVAEVYKDVTFDLQRYSPGSSACVRLPSGASQERCITGTIDEEMKDVKIDSLTAEISREVTAASSSSRLASGASQERLNTGTIEKEMDVKSDSQAAEVLKDITSTPYSSETQSSFSLETFNKGTIVETKSCSFVAEILRDATFDKLENYCLLSDDEKNCPYNDCSSGASSLNNPGWPLLQNGSLTFSQPNCKNINLLSINNKENEALKMCKPEHPPASSLSEGKLLNVPGGNGVRGTQMTAAGDEEVLSRSCSTFYAASEEQALSRSCSTLHYEELTQNIPKNDVREDHANNKEQEALGGSYSLIDEKLFRNTSQNESEDTCATAEEEKTLSGSCIDLLDGKLTQTMKNDSKGKHMTDEKQEAQNRSCSNTFDEKLIQSTIKKNDSKGRHVTDEGQEAQDRSYSNTQDEKLSLSLSLTENKLLVQELMSKDQLLPQPHSLPDSLSIAEESEKRDTDTVKRDLKMTSTVESQGCSSSDHWKMSSSHFIPSSQNMSLVKDTENSRNASYPTSSPNNKNPGNAISTSDPFKLLRHYFSNSHRHFKDPGSTNSTSDHSKGLYHHLRTSHQHQPPTKNPATSTSSTEHSKVLNYHPNTLYHHSPLIKNPENNGSVTDHWTGLSHQPGTSDQHLSPTKDMDTSRTSESVGPGETDHSSRAREVVPIPTVGNTFWSIITPKERGRLCVQGAPRKPYKPTLRRCSPRCRRNLAKEFADGNLHASLLPHSPPFSPFRETDMFKMDDFIILE